MTMNIRVLSFSAVIAAAGILSVDAAMIPVGPKTDSFLGYNVENVELAGDNLVAEVSLDFSQVNLPSNREVTCTPMWVNGTDTLFFNSFTIAGRGRFYYDIRNTQPTDVVYKGWGKNRGELSKESNPLAANVNTLVTTYQPWMENATFELCVLETGCAYCRKTDNDFALAQTDFTPRLYEAEFLFVTPEAETVKTREISARAYIDFPVNKTEIYPDFRRNPMELAKIRATIDSVKNDKDITITSLHISGTASPEGPYQNNVRLAKGRTEALAEYVRKLYSFPKGFIKESYEPVDWAGLEEWLKKNTIENGEAILNIVTGSLPPEERNNNIKKYYPKQYAWLLENVYPSLRHSDYAIEFNIRTFTSAEEIIEIMQTQPSKLSLNELFVAAQSVEEGSEVYNDAMEIAVRMYPNDETANLNAGVAALKRGDYTQAKRFLDKSGNSDQAEYSRAVYEALNGNEAEAYEMFMKLSSCDNREVREKAALAARQLSEKLNFKGNFTTLM